MTARNPFHEYSVKGVKTLQGREGYGFQASLYRNGKKIAVVSDFADGATVRFDWMDIGAPQVGVTVHRSHGDFQVKMTPEEARLHSIVDASPQKFHALGVTVSLDADMAVSYLVNAKAAYNTTKKHFLKKVCILENGDFYTVDYNRPPNATILAHHRAHHPGDLVINDMAESDVIDAVVMHELSRMDHLAPVAITEMEPASPESPDPVKLPSPE